VSDHQDQLATATTGLEVDGGTFQPRVEKLLVGRRDCTRLVDGVLRQLDQVRSHLVGFDTGVSGMLCFVNADWPLIGGSFELRGINVVWPKRAIRQIQKPGTLTSAQINAIHRHLNEAFPQSAPVPGRPTSRGSTSRGSS
jgi:hypothetical protein